MCDPGKNRERVHPSIGREISRREEKLDSRGQAGVVHLLGDGGVRELNF